MVEGIEEVIVSLYAKGMSVSDIEEQIKDVYKFEVSTTTIRPDHFPGSRRHYSLAEPSSGTRLPDCVDGWYRV